MEPTELQELLGNLIINMLTITNNNLHHRVWVTTNKFSNADQSHKVPPGEKIERLNQL